MSSGARAGAGQPPWRISALADAIRAVAALDAPADARLRQFFRSHPKMGVQDRAFVAEGVFAYLRRMRSLEAIAETRDPHHLALAVLVREMGRSLRDLAPLLPASDDIWLRAFKSRMHNALPPAVAHDVPDCCGIAWATRTAMKRARSSRARGLHPRRWTCA